MLADRVRLNESPAMEAWANRRAAVAACLQVVALVLVAGPALDLFRLDPIVGSISIRSADDIVEARALLKTFELLDDANGLWAPLLFLKHDLPAFALVLAAIALGVPRQQARLTRRALLFGSAFVVIVMLVPQITYWDTISALTRITD